MTGYVGIGVHPCLSPDWYRTIEVLNLRVHAQIDWNPFRKLTVEPQDMKSGSLEPRISYISLPPPVF